MIDREKHLDWFCRLKSNLKVFIPKDFHLDEFEQSLDYAISSIKTDLKYDLMFDGEDVYTKADMVAMLTELQLEIEETDSGCGWEGYRPTAQVIGLIQQKINDLLGKDENIGEERQNEKSN